MTPAFDTVEARLELFSRVPKFSYFTLQEKEILAQHSSARKIEAHGVVYAELTKADSFGVIGFGVAHKQNAVNRRPLGPTTVLGTLPLLRRNENLRRRTAGIVAQSECIVVDIPYKALDHLAPERKDAFIDSIAEDALTLIERIDH
jgi:hypothetical protein